MKWVFVVCSLLLSLSVYSTPVDSLRTEQGPDGRFVIHQVEEQETLYSLARRYGGTVQGIIKHNDIIDSKIEIGQVIRILIEEAPKASIETTPVVNTSDPSNTGFHRVAKGETLYSIAQMYDVKVKDLKKWNDLESNVLALEMELKVKKDATVANAENSTSAAVEPKQKSTDSIVVVDTDPWEGFNRYLVQTGETLYTIASKLKVNVDSLKLWNELRSDYLKIGQELMYRGIEAHAIDKVIAPNKKIRTRIDENGFEKVFEEGIASVIESMPTTRFLALHRSLPIGSNIEVRNLMNNQVVHVRVIGRLPDTGLNENILLRLSKPAYDQLGILDSRSRVEVSYFKN